jgi:hypothetical protein
MIKCIDSFWYDIICDRCGVSITKFFHERATWHGVNERTLERFRAKLWSDHSCLGWRFNPRNQTIVCPNCALIINKKGGEK